MEDKLAVNGGKPVLNKKLPPSFPGALMIDENEINQVLEVLKNKSLFRYYGPNLLNKVKKFEEKFSEFIGTSYTLAVSSGTASLFISLKAMGLGEGDKVLVPGYTWISTPLTVVECGAKPVICDIDDSLEIDPASIEEKLSNDDIKAIIPVHMRGAPCRMAKIQGVSDNAGNVYWGGAGVTVPNGTTDTTSGIALSAGTVTSWIPVLNLNEIYIIGDNAGDDIVYVCLG